MPVAFPWLKEYHRGGESSRFGFIYGIRVDKQREG
jgi:hypothetical protein